MKSGRATTNDVEEALCTVHDVRDNKDLHPGVCPIFVDFAVYSFKSLYDAEGRRKSFDVLHSLAEKGSIAMAKKIFDFVKDNLNNMRYKEVKSLIISLIDFLSEKSSNLINELLLDLLNYEHLPCENLLETLLEMPQKI